MAAVSAIIAGAAVAAAVGGTIVQNKQAKKAAEQTKQIADRQEAQQESLRQEALGRERMDSMLTERASQRSRQRQLQIASRAGKISSAPTMLSGSTLGGGAQSTAPGTGTNTVLGGI